MKKLFAILLLILILLPGCARQNTDGVHEESTVPSGTLEWTELLSAGDDCFVSLMTASAPEDLPYMKAGEMVRFEFPDGAPDTVELRDYVLRDNGNIKYSASGGGGLYMDIPVELDGGEVSFEIQANIASYLSSYSGDYLPGATIRGLRMICSWSDETREYGFVFRSDAGISFVQES